ncbi:DUF1376 domain-containing protein [Dyella sp.]|uniref:DUF1376 domain-containing protein n=1 Tax=Dyella sp. TaxID=1869338 RepID=UPI002FDADB31
MDVDLRGLPFMPLDVNRLRDSQLAISASGDEFRAAVLLWCASWNQVPAASLPDDDASLATYAGYGRDLKSWKKVKQGAMRGFVHCSDGRWYHPVVADKALEAWTQREDFQAEKENEKVRKQRERLWRKAAFAALRAIGVVPHWNERTAALRDLVEQRGLAVTLLEHQNVTPPVTGHVTPPVTVTCHGPDTAKRGTGTGIKEQEQKLPASPGAEAPEPPDPIFGTGLKFLCRKGVQERPARSFLGLLRKDVGDLCAAELLAKAESDDVTDPLAWLRASAKARKTPPIGAADESWAEQSRRAV